MKIKDYYSTIAGAYFEKQDSTTQVWPELASWLLERTPPKSKVLDAACGPGIESQRFQEAGHTVTGCDFSPRMVEIYKKNLPDARCEVANLCSLPFLDHEFDVVLASFCFLHLNDRDGAKAVEEIARVLEPGGIFFVATAFGDGSTVQRRHRVSAGLPVEDIPFHWWSKKAFLDLMAINGFELIDETEYRKYEQLPALTCLSARKKNIP